MKKKIILWLLLIIWCSVIFLFSNQSADDSSYLSSNLAEFLKNTIMALKNIAAPVFKPLYSIDIKILAENLEFIIRKLAHFTIFFILGAISVPLCACYTQKKAKNFLIPLLFCVFYAICDEFHQFFVPGRSARIFDVFIDSLGSLCGICFLLLLSDYRFNKKNKRK